MPSLRKSWFFKTVFIATTAFLFVFFQNCSKLQSIEIPTSVPEPTVTPSGNPEISPIDFTGVFNLNNRIPITTYGCNTVSFGHHPALGNKFIGRLLKFADTYGCYNGEWGLELLEMNWTTGRLTRVKEVFRPLYEEQGAIEDGVKKITGAMDPTVTYWNGEIWVAFECHGVNFPGSSATCIGPLKKDFTLDITRTTAPVLGISHDADENYFYSASVPKIVTHKQKIYLYWSAMKIEKGTQASQHITSRGIELKQEADGLRRLWTANSAGAPAGTNIASNHPLSVEVLGLNEDALSNRVADMFQVVSDGNYLYSTAALGGDGCYAPDSPVPGCYRLAISRSSEALMPRTFNASYVPSEVLPPNPQEYYRFVLRATDDKTLIMGGNFLNPLQLEGVPLGTQAYEWPESIFKYACNARTQLWPNWGEKNGKCLPSCGGIGGTMSFADRCENHNMESAGDSYDVSYCCK